MERKRVKRRRSVVRSAAADRCILAPFLLELFPIVKCRFGPTNSEKRFVPTVQRRHGCADNLERDQRLHSTYTTDQLIVLSQRFV